MLEPAYAAFQTAAKPSQLFRRTWWTRSESNAHPYGANVVSSRLTTGRRSRSWLRVGIEPTPVAAAGRRVPIIFPGDAVAAVDPISCYLIGTTSPETLRQQNGQAGDSARYHLQGADRRLSARLNQTGSRRGLQPRSDTKQVNRPLRCREWSRSPDLSRALSITGRARRRLRLIGSKLRRYRNRWTHPGPEPGVLDSNQHLRQPGAGYRTRTDVDRLAACRPSHWTKPANLWSGARVTLPLNLFWKTSASVFGQHR